MHRRSRRSSTSYDPSSFPNGHSPIPNSVRFKVECRDVPISKAARRLHLTVQEFEAVKEELYRRGFPRPDLTTGMYDLYKIDEWMSLRHEITPQSWNR